MTALRHVTLLNILFALFLLSCTKKNVEAIELIPTKPLETSNTTHPYVLQLDSISKQEWKWYYSKLDVNFNDQSKSISFKSSVKSTKDSATNILITFSRIPIINSLISQDSILVVNKKDRCYQVQSIAYFKELLSLDLSLANLQEILLGLPINFNKELEYSVLEKDSLVILNCTQLVSHSSDSINKKLLCSYFYNPLSKCFQKEIIESNNDQTKIEILYSGFQKINGIILPKLLSLTVTSPNKNILIEITYEKIELNIPQDINLSIPENYENCN